MLVGGRVCVTATIVAEAQIQLHCTRGSKRNQSMTVFSRGSNGVIHAAEAWRIRLNNVKQMAVLSKKQ